ncbi:DUF3060 domain-containing protein [Sphingomonas sp. HF-S4]|uniref:DUF3060 domain-containing protein n=1 Tax=Sphingomonas agrestis TaxID=3080540 RepID=A0ABU3Y543_9SPHN|nr:DUF3060 domain-containing protein [Sphingomonas sp. HF-S4]MDV3456529.1 DUF3060 domain-containing protein [Sphingomonas sp. HF-S4]
MRYRNMVFLGLAPAALLGAMPAQAQADFTGAGEESELDCNGGAASIEGASNVMTITGACTSLTITGAGNRVTIDLAKVSRIRVVGASNEIYWRAPGTAKPRLSVQGAGNRISRAR